MLMANELTAKLGGIESLIRTARGLRVMLDSDLANVYGVELKRLNQQVQRNLERFPRDFAFQLTPQESDRKSTRLNSSRSAKSRMPSSA